MCYNYIYVNTRGIIMEQHSKEVEKLIKLANKSGDYSKVESMLNEDISILKNANTICSFDMEFSDRDGKTITEIAFSIHSKINGKTFSEHLIIEEQLGQYTRRNTPVEHSEMYAYGQSKVISLKEGVKMLNRAIKSADASILYIPHHKQKHFEEHGFDDIEFSSLQDMLKLQKRQSNALSLSQAVDFFCQVEQPTNNAGNDAVATLEILSKNFGKEIGLENFYLEATNDYSNDPRKKSGVEIRESRRTMRKQDKIADKAKQEVSESKVKKPRTLL